MVIILTAACVILGLGLVLLVIGLKGRSRPVAVAPADDIPVAGDSSLEYSSATRRRVRVIPLVLGILLTLAGGAAVATVVSEGLDSDRWDKVVMSYWPAGSLADDLDAEDFSARYNAARELQARYEAGRLPDNVEQRLVNRHIARLTEDDTAPDAPAPGAPIVEFNFVEMREAGKLADGQWGKVVARTAPMRFDIPRRVAPGEPINLRLVLSLDDPKAPAWVIVQVADLMIDGKPVAIPAVAVAPNPAWEPPPPGEPPVIDPNAPPGPPPGPPPSRRVVRHEFPLPQELVASLGLGSKQVTGRVVVYAFDPGVVSPPTDAMTDDATFMPRSRNDQPSEEMVAAAFSAKLTPEQAQEFISRALGEWEYPIDRRMEIGEVPPRTPPVTPPAEEGDDAGGDAPPEQGEAGPGGD